MNEQELQKAFLLFLAKKSGAKNEKELLKYVLSLGEDGLKQAYAEFQQVLLNLAKKAKHGAKLDYFKKLKNQCAEDEEVYFFKKGGVVGCGCKKKMQDGGKADNKMKNMPWVDEFKQRRAKKKEEEAKKEKALQAQRERDAKFADDENKGYGHVEKNKGITKNECGSKITTKFKKHRLGGSLNNIFKKKLMKVV